MIGYPYRIDSWGDHLCVSKTLTVQVQVPWTLQNHLGSQAEADGPGKKRKKDETCLPVIVQPLSSSVPETSTIDYPNYYTDSIKRTNGQPFSKYRIMQVRKSAFLIAKVNFELVFKQDESIDIYFTSSQAADHVLSKSKEIILDGSKLLATKKRCGKVTQVFAVWY